MKKRRSNAKARRAVPRKSRPVSARRTRRTSVANGSKQPPRESTAVGPATPPVPQTNAFRMESRPGRYWSITGVILVVGAISIYFYGEILVHMHNYYTLVLVVPLYAYIFGDLIHWLATGVRAVELESDGVNVVLPGNRPAKRIHVGEMGSVRISSTLDGKTVYILLHGATSRRFLWMEYFSGPRIRIPAAPFDKNDFTEFVKRIGNLKTASPQS